MRMTIEEHIEVLNSYNHGFTGCAGNLQDSIDVAIDIMHKYQKIERIIDAAELTGEFKKSKSSYWLNLVKGVIEDRNDD